MQSSTPENHTNESIMARAKNLFPGGVNSPVRSFRSVGGTPIVFSHGKGTQLTSVEGKNYLDFCQSWGPLILGYGNEIVQDAVYRQSLKALTFGAPCHEEVLLGELVKEFFPKMEMLRFVSSGTEATMSAVRAARAYTGKPAFIKFEGCYHGHADAFLVKAGSGLATLGAPDSLGVPKEHVQHTLTAPYNNLEAVQKLFEASIAQSENKQSQIAAIIIEPMAANMGLVLPAKGYLEGLRKLCDTYGAVLIFDEVMTGFRIEKHGAAAAFGVEPDMWTLGKIVGGGLPAAAYGGKKEIMAMVSPLGKAYQAGTLSGNPMAMAAGLATLKQLKQENFYSKIEATGKALDAAVEKNLKPWKEKFCYLRKASFFVFFFGTNVAPQNFDEVSQCNMDAFGKIYQLLLNESIYLGPSGYEVGFFGATHTENDMERLVLGIQKGLQMVFPEG